MLLLAVSMLTIVHTQLDEIGENFNTNEIPLNYVLGGEGNCSCNCCEVHVCIGCACRLPGQEPSGAYHLLLGSEVCSCVVLVGGGGEERDVCLSLPIPVRLVHLLLGSVFPVSMSMRQCLG